MADRKNLSQCEFGNGSIGPIKGVEDKKDGGFTKRRNSDTRNNFNQHGFNDEKDKTLNAPARMKRRIKRNNSEPVSETKQADFFEENRRRGADLTQTCPTRYLSSDYEEQNTTRLKTSETLKSSKKLSQRRQSAPSSSFLHGSDFVTSVVQDAENGSDAVINICEICAYQDVECGYCKDCKQYLCKPCCEGHRKINTTKSHTLIFTEKVSQDIEFRERSRELQHEIYAGQFQTSKHVDETDCQSIGQDLRKLLKKLSSLRSTKSKQLESLENETNISTNQIQQFKNDLVQHINAWTKISVENASYKHELRRNEAENEKKKLESYIQEITILCRKIDISRLHGCSQKEISELTADAYERYLEIIADANTLEQKFCEMNLHFSPHPKLCNLKESVASLGDVEFVKENTMPDTSPAKIEDHEFSSWCPGDKMETTCVTGLACLHDGRLVLADQDNKTLKLFDSEFKHRSRIELPVPPWTVTVTANNKILVTLPELKQFWQFSVEYNDIKKEISMETDRECLGIVEVGDEVIISSYDGDIAELIAISKFGGITSRATYNVLNKNCTLKRPNYIQKSKNSKILFVSDVDMGLLGISICDLQTVLFSYNSSDLLSPLGLAVDAIGNIYVCGLYSHNIHQLTCSGQLIRILTNKQVTPAPQCIGFCGYKNAVIVSLDKQYDLKVLKFC